MSENTRENESNDFIASALLATLKEENRSKDAVISGQKHIIFGMLLTIALIVGGFLWYLNQYDFSSTESITATGVYTLLDSKGNVIAQDFSSDELESILEVVTDGEDRSETYSEED